LWAVCSCLLSLIIPLWGSGHCGTLVCLCGIRVSLSARVCAACSTVACACAIKLFRNSKSRAARGAAHAGLSTLGHPAAPFEVP
jgi:hypothetical protein